MNIALTEDLQRLVRKRVETGQFPNEQAVVEQALRVFLMDEPARPDAEPESGKEDDGHARPWRGVYALELPEDVLFTKSIDIRPDQLGEWRPHGVTSEKQVRQEDE